LRAECANGRDESANCLFSNALCQGLANAGKKCLFFITPQHFSSDSQSSSNEPFSWNDAFDACEAQGGKMASIRTAQEADGLTDAWQYIAHHEHWVGVGLKFRWHSQPFIYKNMFRWVDKTVAYHYFGNKDKKSIW
jgi:hypothetical protein